MIESARDSRTKTVPLRRSRRSGINECASNCGRCNKGRERKTECPASAELRLPRCTWPVNKARLPSALLRLTNGSKPVHQAHGEGCRRASDKVHRPCGHRDEAAPRSCRRPSIRCHPPRCGWVHSATEAMLLHALMQVKGFSLSIDFDFFICIVRLLREQDVR